MVRAVGGAAGGGPGQGPRRDGPGGGFGGRDGGFGGRDGGRGRGDGPGRGRGRDRAEGPVGPGQRVIADLSTLEKALGKSDFAAEKSPLEAIVRSLRTMRVKSLEELDLNVRGRLITTLLRVQRQTRPPEAGEPGTARGRSGGRCRGHAGSRGGRRWRGRSGEAPAEGAEAAAPAEGAATPAAPAADPAKEKFQAYVDVMFLVGRAWRAAGDPERAAAAFALSGREPQPEREEPAAARPPAGERREGERREGRERGERREGRERGERREGREGERASAVSARERPASVRPEGERRERGERERRQPLPELTGDWKEQATQLEGMGRTRDAARMHERNNSFADATRLFEAGGDLKSALRSALAGKDNDTARRLHGDGARRTSSPQVLEKAGAYELLMEHLHRQG